MADQRTEEPTQRRLERARQDGNFPQAKEFVSALQFFGFLALLFSVGRDSFFDILRLGRSLLTRAFSLQLTPSTFVALARHEFLDLMKPILLAGAALVMITLSVQLMVSGFGLMTAKLAPDLKRLDFFSRIKGLPAQNLPMLAQALVLLPVVTWIVYYEARENLQEFLTLPWLAPQAGLLRMMGPFKALFWRIAFLFLVVGSIDFAWQRRRYMGQMRMTKQEVRDEAKESQGNPQIKSRIRRIQRDMARRQMMKDIPKATAVIVNPTHYAVAIRYSLESGGAPRVVAKGKNYLALRIRKLAILHQVPIVENPPLAQSLYKSAEVGQEIPADLYRAVAEILAYIYRLMGGKLPG